MDLIRVFLGIRLTQSNQVCLSKFQISLKNLINSGLTWVQPGNFHLTLGFLGELDQKSIDNLVNELELELSQLNQSTCFFTGLGAFPNFRQPRVIWIGVKNTPELVLLTSTIHEICHKNGLKVNAEKTTPHVTLARIKKYLKPAEILAAGKKFMQVKSPNLTDQILDRVLLIKSELRPIGPLYTTLHVFLIPPT